MRQETRALVTGAGIAEADVSYRVSAMMRYVGQGYEIDVTVDAARLESEGAAMLAAGFAEAYRARYGRVERMASEILSWRVVGAGPRPPLASALSASSDRKAEAPVATGSRPVFFGDGFVDTPVYARMTLASGQTLVGPAIIEEDESTLVVPPSFDLTVDVALNLVADRRVPA